METDSDFERIAVRDGHLAGFAVGEGPAVIFLHGGPGDTHHYMRRMAEPLLSKFRCIFFDQRGTGRSSDFPREPGAYTVESLVDDILAVGQHFSFEKPSLVGHSWGAMLALFAAIEKPQAFDRVATISMGPLNPAMGAATTAHLLSVLSEVEKMRWHELRAQRNEARDRGDFKKVADADRELMFLRVRTWIVNEELRGPFLEEYFLDPPPDREVNKWIWLHAENWLQFERLAEIARPIWLCAGANDAVPLGQPRALAAKLKDCRLTIFELCGHMPWLEHPHAFYEELETFLS